ncbi:GNAT family N-acetyltransferase [Mucilaginibacter sp.]|uniref:GNAT family N-acetyltransferase n=1 Tax=Mucilaginibacter sp. TaxID=1882438 RepID=UPI0026217E55|nr:GNAT family N-acetyltransferase [Mucilaginibacter sp.]MDB4922470.1 paiA 1 [Mucilaginibacter sp.]
MINIKQCDINQADVLFDIAIQTYKQTYTYLWLDAGEAYLKRFYGKDDLEKDLTIPEVSWFLVYYDNKAAGYFKVKENALSPYTPQQCLEIEKLYLLQQYTGKGMGKAIMSFIFDLTKRQQRPILWVKVMESSPALLFYEAFGFKQTDRTCLDYPFMIDEYRWLLTYILEIS